MILFDFPLADLGFNRHGKDRAMQVGVPRHHGAHFQVSRLKQAELWTELQDRDLLLQQHTFMGVDHFDSLILPGNRAEDVEGIGRGRIVV